MPDPIEVNYVPDGDDWQVTVAGRGQRLTGRAPGLIAARDRADQLVEELAPNAKLRTVVHLLEGDAVEFTNAYLTARLAKPASPDPDDTDEADEAEARDEEPDEEADRETGREPVRPPAPRANSDDAASKAGANHGRSD